MTTADVAAHRSLEYTPARGWTEYVNERNNGPRPLTTMGTAQRDAYMAGWRDALRTLGKWEGMPVEEAVWELRAGRSSVFYELFRHDPSLWCDCPRCEGRVIIRADGQCPNCHHDFTED